jgi:hypothetical protein
MDAVASDFPAAQARTPAQRILEYLGGLEELCFLSGRSRSSVYRWLQPQAKGGHGGLIPGPAQRALVRNAPPHLPLDFADFAPRAGEVVL